MSKGPQGRVSHYMVDCHLAGGAKESFPIRASSESEAIREAKIHAPQLQPTHFAVRAVARKGDTIIYRSENA
jgi:hypothetical protein